MKKILTGIIAVVFVTCATSNALTREEIEKNPILKGKFLAKRCSWCHDINRPLIAPPFKTILERYKDIPESTLKKQFFNVIKNGSKGKWTEWLKKNVKTKMGQPDAMYMPPQKPYYSDEEIKLIVNWLMSLRK
ncbi:c-type cytochrome [Persephonella sp.]|jgi:cytochrome c551/c552